MTWRFPRLPIPGRPVAADGGANAAGEDHGAAGGTGTGTGVGNAAWVDVGGLADLRQNRLVVDLDGTSVLVVRAGRALAAVENECPHLGQRLSDGDVSGRVIQCAAHGYRWDLGTGQPVQGLRVQRRRPLRAVPLRLAGDRIMLAVDADPVS